MMTPQKPGGSQAQGKIKVQIAIHALTIAATELDPSSKEGQACLEAVVKLTKTFGKKEEDSKALMPAEIMQVMQGAAGPGAPPPGIGAKPPGAGPQPGIQ